MFPTYQIWLPAVLHRFIEDATICEVFTLRNAWLQEIIRTKFNGPAKLIQSWPSEFKPPHRSTLWRWLKDEVAMPPNQILPLAGALDIDPFALFETTPHDYANLCLAVINKIASKSSTKLISDVEWVHNFIVPNRAWPPKDIAVKFFSRNWRLESFQHTAQERINYFRLLEITAPKRAFLEPQAWHFAFKVPDTEQPVWNPYGVVIREGRRVRLYHLRGQMSEVEIASGAESFFVETYFGLGPADFRIASLHPFTLTLAHEQTISPCVRFR